MTISPEDWRRFSVDTDHIVISDVMGDSVEVSRIKKGPWAMYAEYDEDHAFIEKVFVGHEGLLSDMLGHVRQGRSKKPSRISDLKRELDLSSRVVVACDKSKAPDFCSDPSEIERFVAGTFDFVIGLPSIYSDGDASAASFIGSGDKLVITLFENPDEAYSIDGIGIEVGR